MPFRRLGLNQGQLVRLGDYDCRGEGEEEGRYLLGKANEILVIGVDVGELNVNQQHDLN